MEVSAASDRPSTSVNLLDLVNIVPTLISLLLPTRGRPKLCERFFQSVLEQSRHPDAVEIIMYVDDDDTESHHLAWEGLNIRRIIGPRLTMGAYNSRCLAESQGGIIVLVNDDMIIRTKGWDERLRALDASIPDKVYLAYGNDLFKGGKLCTFPILSRRTCDVLGDPYPTAYRGAFIDYHLLDIFKRLQHRGEDRIRYLEDVVFEHLHFRAGKAEVDQTYTQRGRFADDGDFLGLTRVRDLAARHLYQSIRGETPPAAPPTQSDAVPQGLVGVLTFITRSILLDGSLPLRWRGFLWYWFIGRQLAARGLLGPFVKR
jgi:hypothetical protein